MAAAPPIRLGIAGTGLMGRGIAQVAAQAGCEVRLYDTRAGAAQSAKESIAAQLGKLVEKGKCDRGEAARAIERLAPVASLAQFEGCGVVVEAIVEDLEAKRELFRALERAVAPDCVLGTPQPAGRGLEVLRVRARAEEPAAGVAQRQAGVRGAEAPHRTLEGGGAPAHFPDQLACRHLIASRKNI